MIDENATAKDYSLIIYSKTETDLINSTESTRVDTELDGKADASDLGSPSGIATLDPTGRHTLNQIPIASVDESGDDTNDSTVISPERLHYQINTRTISTDKVGVANGIAPLGADSIIPDAYLPPTRIVQTFVVETLAELYAITTALEGDRGVVTSEVDPADNGEYVANVDYPIDVTGWDLLPNLSAVTSVNGQTGVVNITSITESASNATAITGLDGRVTTAEEDIDALETLTGTHTTDIDALEAPDSTIYNGLATAPAHVEGRIYYNTTTDSINVQGTYSGVELKVGHEQHIHVVNNTGVLIEKGMAVTQIGVDGAGNVQITKAIATSFNSSRIFGITTHEILDGERGSITTFGEITSIDTSGYPTGVPLYLSDTVAGTYTSTAPDIISRVGGALSADVNGRLFVNIINNKNTPSVFGGLQGQTVGNETYSLTTTSQDIINYDSSKSVVVGVNALTGELTLPNTGEYRMHFTAAITFASSTSTRSVTLELYDVTGALIHFPYVKNIPRDATEDSLSFSWAIDELAGNVHKMRIKASTVMDVTFNNISFDIQSVSID